MLPVLNLLPPAYKQELKRTTLLLFVHEILFFIFITASLGALIMLAAHFILSQKFREVVLEDIPGTAKVERLNREVKLINNELLALETALQNSRLWSGALRDILRAAPEEIIFSSLKLTAPGTLEIQGESASRENLLEFKQKLAAIPYLRDIELPLQALAQNKRGNFQITAVLDSKILPP